MSRRRIVAGNWKMNGSLAANRSLIEAIVAKQQSFDRVEVLVCPPTVYLPSVQQFLGGSTLALGAQNLCEQQKAGAFTGEIQGAMLREVGCSHVLVGHSERRALYGEDDARVAEKFVAAQAAGLVPILCVGETRDERESNRTEAVLARQLDAVVAKAGIAALENAVLAYEPVWAIGTGLTATPAMAQAAHAFLRQRVRNADATIADSLRVLYGGSVKPDNALELFACDDVDGGLIGGASLKAADFLGICEAAQKLAA